MGCCGHGRAALRASRSPHARGSLPPPASATTAASAVTRRVRFTRGGSAQYRGDMTGRRYAFTPAEPVQDVDPADLPVLLRTGLFVVVG